MLLAKQRLPDRIKFWHEYIDSFEINFREKKVLSTPMFRWCCREILPAGAAVPLFDSYK